MNGLVFGVDDAVGQWVMQAVGGRWLPSMGTAIGLASSEGELRAGVVYEDYTGQDGHVISHIHCLPGTQLSRQFLWCIHDYPFSQLRVARITAPIRSDNLRARQFVQKLGFCHEATLRAAHQQADLLFYVSWREQCRWLKLGNRYHG